MARKETGLQFLARLGSRPSLEGLQPLLFGTGPRGRDVVELYGGEGTGKTELVMYLVARIILPDVWRDVPLGGHDAGVIFIDTDYKFSILRLSAILEKFILGKVELHRTSQAADTTDGVNPVDPNNLEVFIKQCLARLYILRCESSAQLVLSLHNLETIISNDPSISAVVIDSISAFYWVDRFRGGETIQEQESSMKYTAQILEKLVSTYNLTVFATKTNVFKKKMNAGFGGKEDGDIASSLMYTVKSDLEVYHAEFLCKAWQSLVTHRLVLVSCHNPGNQEVKYMVGGDCAQGNRQFTVNQAGIQFEQYS